MCEACGDACDPARLLLCDDCDISYHTYCLDPPLLMVPKGSWKCKWWVEPLSSVADRPARLIVCPLSPGVCGAFSVAPPPLACDVIG